MNRVDLISLDHISIGKVISGFGICPTKELSCKYYPTYEGDVKEEVEVPRISKSIDKFFGLSSKKVIKSRKDKFSAIVQLDTKGSPVVLEDRILVPGEKTSIKCPKYGSISPGSICFYSISPVKISKLALYDNLGKYYSIYQFPYISIQLSGHKNKIEEEETKRYYFDNSEDMMGFLNYLFEKGYVNLESILPLLMLIVRKWKLIV